MFVPTLSERRIVGRHFATTSFTIGHDQHQEVIHVSVENAATYGRLKVLAEDVGLLTVYPEKNCIIVRGLSFTYVIHGDDVEALSLHANHKSILITYKVANEELALTIVPRSIQAELSRQVVGSSHSLFDRMRLALNGADETEGS